MSSPSEKHYQRIKEPQEENQKKKLLTKQSHNRNESVFSRKPKQTKLQENRSVKRMKEKVLSSRKRSVSKDKGLVGSLKSKEHQSKPKKKLNMTQSIKTEL